MGIFYLFVFLGVGVRSGRSLSVAPNHFSCFSSLGSLKGWDYKRFHSGTHSESASWDYKARQSSIYRLICNDKESRHLVLPSFRTFCLWPPGRELFCFSSLLYGQSVSCAFYSHLLVNSKLLKDMQKSVKMLIVIQSC